MSNKITKSAVQHPSKHDWMAQIGREHEAANELLQELYRVAETDEQRAYLEAKSTDLQAGYQATLQMAQANDQMYSALKLNLDAMESIRAELQELKETVANLSHEADAKTAKKVKRARADAYREGQWDAVRSGQVRAANTKRF